MEFVKKFKALPNGRKITVGAIYNEETHEMRFGVAVCRPGDQFSPKQGRDKSLGRAKSGRAVYHHEQLVPSPDRSELNAFFYKVAEQLQNQKNEEIEMRLQILANLA